MYLPEQPEYVVHLSALFDPHLVWGSACVSMLHDACEFVSACCMQHVNLGVLVGLKGLSDVYGRLQLACWLFWGEFAQRACCMILYCQQGR